MSQETTTCHNQDIVSTDWLANTLQKDASALRLFDATFHLTDKTRDAQQEYAQQHIHGAQFFDITTIADTESPWPNTVPSADQFQSAMQSFGVNSDSTIIAYDALGLFSAARVWWLARYFGYNNVAVLDGGLPKWLSENKPTDSEAVVHAKGDFKANAQARLLNDVGQVHGIVKGEIPAAIVDARGAGRFAGSSPEPRKGLRAGHIPGSFNVPYNQLLNEDHTFKTPNQITTIFNEAGVNPQQPIVASCGSGVTACILALGLAQLGANNTAVFDGSWTQWGSTESLPVATL